MRPCTQRGQNSQVNPLYPTQGETLCKTQGVTLCQIMKPTTVFGCSSLKQSGGTHIRFKRERRDRQHDPPADLVAEPPVYVTLFNSLKYMYIWTEETLHTARETNSAKVKIVLTPRTELSNPLRMRPHAQRKSKIQAGISRKERSQEETQCHLSEMWKQRFETHRVNSKRISTKRKCSSPTRAWVFF